MPRVARVVVEGIAYHVTQRGNRREDIFFEDEDRQKYLQWLQEYSSNHNLKIWAYCLMTNHIHLIVVPQNGNSLEKVMRPLHMRYAQHINRKKGWSGHLWQGRFFSIHYEL
jgi:putative transposase